MDKKVENMTLYKYFFEPFQYILIFKFGSLNGETMIVGINFGLLDTN